MPPFFLTGGGAGSAFQDWDDDAHVIRPFSTRKETEILAAPKVYGFDTANLGVFRRLHPEGENIVVAQDVEKPYRRTVKGLTVDYCGIGDLGGVLKLP